MSVSVRNFCLQVTMTSASPTSACLPPSGNTNGRIYNGDATNFYYEQHLQHMNGIKQAAASSDVSSPHSAYFPEKNSALAMSNFNADRSCSVETIGFDAKVSSPYSSLG